MNSFMRSTRKLSGTMRLTVGTSLSGLPFLLLCAGLLMSFPAKFAYAEKTSVAPVEIVELGDPRRKILLNALRGVIETDLEQPLRFVVAQLRVQDSWAFAEVHPRSLANNPIDFSKTRHAERFELGMADADAIFVLLHYDGRTWKIKDFIVCPTDVAQQGWVDRFGVTMQLLGLDYRPEPIRESLAQILWQPFSLTFASLVQFVF